MAVILWCYFVIIILGIQGLEVYALITLTICPQAMKTPNSIVKGPVSKRDEAILHIRELWWVIQDYHLGEKHHLTLKTGAQF